MTRKERIQKVLDYHKRVEKAWEEAKKMDKIQGTDGDHVIAFLREMVCNDVYFLLYYVLERKDICYEEWEEGAPISGTDAVYGEGDELVSEKDGKRIWRYYRPFLFERCREIQKHPDGYLDIWARDHYKDLADDTPVLTLDGWKTQGTLEVGDYVYTPKGFSKVVAVRHFTDSHCRKINFKGGASVVCGNGHLWKVNQWNAKRAKGERRIGWEENIVETSQVIKGYKHPYISCPTPFDSEDNILPVDPYVLGVWLGDGDSDSGRVTNDDDEVWNEIQRLGWKISDNHARNQTSVRHCSIYGLHGELRHMGLLGNKHIPKIYLQASYRQRLELFRGLMDTDGSATKRKDDNTCTFVQKNYNLVKDFMALASSLGYRCRVCKQTTKFGTDAYYVSFAVRKDNDSPFHITKKAERINRDLNPQKQSRNWYIQSIEEHETVPTTCIQIEDPDGMYFCTEYCIQTHNSTLITYGMTMQEILRNPEITICIYSYNVSTAKKMLTQIKNDLQSNSTLLTCFPDVLFTNTNVKTWYEDDDVKHLRPHKMEWSDEGFNVKRKTNPKEHTLECSGLVSGQKTGGHYQLLVYDDTVTPESVFTKNQIRKTTEQFKMSINTGSTANMKIRMIGTRYALGDTYEEILKEGIVKLRQYPCVDENGESVLYHPHVLEAKLARMHGAVAATQMYCNPQANNVFQFLREWIPERVPRNKIVLDDYNWYIICDPAYKVSEDADYTVFWVVGATYDNRYLIADLIRDKMSLETKQQRLFKLVNKYSNKRTTPTVIYERISMQSDIQHYQTKMRENKFYFTILEASGKPKLRYGVTGGGNLKYKDIRIQALQPLLREGKIQFVEDCWHENWKGVNEDMLDTWFSEEYDYYPNSKNDDGLDSLSRLADLETGAIITFPIKRETIKRNTRSVYDPYSQKSYRPY